MKVSIVTVTKNSADTLQKTIDSIRSQTHYSIEYIVYDRSSTDATVDVIRDNLDVIDNWTSKPDEGHVRALNEGIRMATGEVVASLGPNSVFKSDDVLSDVAGVAQQDEVDACWGDLIYLKEGSDEVRRYWKSSSFEYGKFEMGWSPPHQTFFFNKKLIKKCGLYNPKMADAAYYELMLRFLKVCRVNTAYIPKTLVETRNREFKTKGLSVIGEVINNQKQIYKAWNINDLDGGLFAPILKTLSETLQYFKKPSK